MGENTEATDDYFNRLQHIIDTNDYEANPNPLGREEFEHDDPDIQYAYLSDAVFKERSGRPKLRAIGQDVADQRDEHERQIPQFGGPLLTDYAPLPECQEDRDFEYGEPNGDHSGW